MPLYPLPRFWAWLTQESSNWTPWEGEGGQAGFTVQNTAAGSPISASLGLGCGWRVFYFPSVGSEMSPEWTWGRQHPGETPAAETTSVHGPVSQELQILTDGSREPPGRFSHRSRNISAPRSMRNNCLDPCEEILSLEKLWWYDRRPVPLLLKIKQLSSFLLFLAVKIPEILPRHDSGVY